LLIKALEIRKELLPAEDPRIADSLRWVGRFLDENCEEVKTNPFVLSESLE
jgi:hypothetical protein